MTPDEASRAIQEAEARWANTPAYCWRALEIIAGTREEWGVEYAGVNHGRRHTEWGYETRDEAERQARRYRLCTDMHPVRTVRRYVTNEEDA